MMAPLMQGGCGIGAISLQRPALGGFTTKEQELLASFADHAVIAIQNARLFKQTQEALERQTATAEVLQVISSSVADAKPVLDKILQSCADLFDTQIVAALLIGEDELVHLAALRAVAAPDAPPGWTEADLALAAQRAKTIYPIPLAGSGTAAAIDAGRVLNFPDVVNGADVPPGTRAAALASGLNYSWMTAPLMQGGRGIGAIAVHRRLLGGFTDKEQDLLKTFADQAVIAIQNAKMFRETQEALERQTATTDVLQVINASPGNLDPVFETIAGKAVPLCEADAGGLWSVEGQVARAAGGIQGNWPAPWLDWALGHDVPLEHLLGREPLKRPFVHVADMKESRAYQAGVPVAVASVDLGGVRTSLLVPLIDNGAVAGILSVSRQTVRPFSERHISLRAGVCIAGADRDEERAADERDARGTGAPDRHVRRAAGDQRITHRRAAGVRRHRRARDGADRLRLQPARPPGR